MAHIHYPIFSLRIDKPVNAWIDKRVFRDQENWGLEGIDTEEEPSGTC